MQEEYDNEFGNDPRNSGGKHEVSNGCVDALRDLVAQMKNSSPQSCATSLKGARAVPAIVINMRDFEKLPRNDLNHLWQLGLAVSGIMTLNSALSTYPIFRNEQEIYNFLDRKGVRYSKTCTIVGDIPNESGKSFIYTPPPTYADGQLFLIVSQDCPYCHELIKRPDVVFEIKKGNILLLDDDNPHKFKAMKEAGVKEEPAWVVWSRGSGFVQKSAWDKVRATPQARGEAYEEEELPVTHRGAFGGPQVTIRRGAYEEEELPVTTDLTEGGIEDWKLLHTPYLPEGEYSFNYLAGGRWSVKRLANFEEARKFLETGFPNTKWSPVKLHQSLLKPKEEIWVPPDSYTLEQQMFGPTANEWIWRVSVWSEMRQRTDLKDYPESELLELKKRVPKLKVNLGSFPNLPDVLYFPSVVIISGSRRKGKTATGYEITELAPADKKFVLGLPDEAEEFVPPEIQTLPLTTEVLDGLPQDCVVFIDEASLEFYAKQNRTDLSKTLDKIIMKTAQKGQTLVFASHNLRKLLSTLVLEASFIIFKEPSRFQVEMERPEIMKLAKLANKEFSKLPPKERVKYGYVISDSFMGMVRTELPSFWTKKLSTAWRVEGDAHVNDNNQFQEEEPSGHDEEDLDY